VIESGSRPGPDPHFHASHRRLTVDARLTQQAHRL